MDGRRDVGVAGILEMQEMQLPLHPYVLGAWLGDGTSCGPMLTAGEDDAEWMAERIRQCGYLARVRHNKKGLKRSASALASTLARGRQT